MLCVKRRKHGRGLQRRAIQQPCYDQLARRKTRPVLMCNGCERPPRGKQATYKRLRRKHSGRQCLYQQIRGEKTCAYSAAKRFCAASLLTGCPKRLFYRCAMIHHAHLPGLPHKKTDTQKAGGLSFCVYDGFGITAASRRYSPQWSPPSAMLYPRAKTPLHSPFQWGYRIFASG